MVASKFKVKLLWPVKDVTGFVFVGGKEETDSWNSVLNRREDF